MCNINSHDARQRRKLLSNGVAVAAGPTRWKNTKQRCPAQIAMAAPARAKIKIQWHFDNPHFPSALIAQSHADRSNFLWKGGLFIAIVARIRLPL
jgi:hypothetical protein